MRVRELMPGQLDVTVDGSGRSDRGGRTPGSTADRFLAPDHPFLRVGAWCAFVAGDGSSEVRVVASLDPRQQVEAGRVGAHQTGASQVGAGRVGTGQVGGIGFIAASGDLRAPATRAALRSALEAAEAWLAVGGAVAVRCPVQFSTWYGHRTIIDGLPQQGGVPRFPMEPGGSPGLGDALAGAGFAVAHRAASYLVAVDRWIAGAWHAEELMRAAGFRDRPIRLDRLDDELSAVHAISMAAFRRSWGFSEITFAEFASIYRPLMPLVDPGLARIVESPDGQPVGFLFAYPDPAVRPGHPGARFIGKTVGVLPETCRATPGVGTGLIVAVHRAAEARGYPTAVHACVADGAYSQRVSARWGERFRTYATFEKVLP